MLIKCPNCNAQYDVPNDIIPAAGRDVQCSSCSKTWFVTSLYGKKSTKDKVSKYESLEKGNLSKFETTESFLTDKSNKEVDRDVLEILREEADREIQARLRDGDGEDTTKKLSNKSAINKNGRICLGIYYTAIRTCCVALNAVSAILIGLCMLCDIA